MDFGATLFFLNPRKVYPLEHFFVEIIEKINLYEQHSKATIILYEKEKTDILKKSKESYDAAIKVANKEYSRILQENGNDEFAHSFAMHESGIDFLQYYYQNEEEEISIRFKKMNNYFTKSSLVLEYALLESELRGLCNLLQTSFQNRISLNDLSEKDYLKSIFTYLDLVINLPIKELADNFKDDFKELQFLRNKIMHNGGEFLSANPNQELNLIINKNNNTISLEKLENNSLLLNVEMNYVIKFYIEIKSFFTQLLWLLDQKLNFTILLNRFHHLFLFLASDLLISNLRLKTIGNIKEVKFELHSKLESKEFSIECNLILKHTAKNNFEILDQVGTIDKLKRLKDHIDKDPSILLSQTLGIFKDSRCNNVKLIIYPL